MKQMTTKWLMSGVALAAMFFTTSVQADVKQGKAVVRAIHGSAKYTKGGGVFVPLKVGDTLYAGNAITTAGDSQVDLFLGDNGPVVRITDATTLNFDKLSINNTGAEKVIETQMDLKNGRILGNVKKLAQASRYEVKIPNGVAGIRGTDYDISSSGEVRCINGSVLVAITRPNGTVQTFTLTAGQQVNPISGVVSTIPAPILAQLKRDVANAISVATVITIPGGGPGGTIVKITPENNPSPGLGTTSDTQHHQGTTTETGTGNPGGGF